MQPLSLLTLLRLPARLPGLGGRGSRRRTFPGTRAGRDTERAFGRSAPIGLLLTLLAVLAPGRAGASVLLTDDEEVIVQAHEVIEDDLVVWAPYVRVDGLVKGDLVVLGSQVVVEGIVERDLLVASKTVYLNGSVGDDVRVACYAVALGEDAVVGDDFWSIDYSLEAKPGSRIGGALHSASRQALLAGQVAEDLQLRAGALDLAGLTGGSVQAVVGGLEGFQHSSLVLDLALEIPTVPEGVTVQDSAAIGGNLDYRSPEPAAVSQGARIAGQVRHEPWRSASSGPAAPSFDGDELLEESGHEGWERLVVLLLVGWTLALLAPAFVGERAERIRAEPVGLLGWGLGTVIGALVLAMILGTVFFIVMVVALATGFGGVALSAIVGGGLAQTVLVAVFLLAAVYLGPVLTSAGIGQALLARVRPRGGDRATTAGALLAVGVGAAVYAALRAVPWLGVWVGLIGSLVGLGSLAIWLRARVGTAPPRPASPTPGTPPSYESPDAR